MNCVTIMSPVFANSLTRPRLIPAATHLESSESTIPRVVFVNTSVPNIPL
jgi:hypothetical protein